MTTKHPTSHPKNFPDAFRNTFPEEFPLDAVALTEALVVIDSRNPSLVPDAPGEGACAAFLAHVLKSWGFRTDMQDVVPGRPNVIARIGPSDKTPLVLNGHLDVVGTDGMIHEPFVAISLGDKLFARGATDMKGGVAAMCVAAARAAASGALQSELIITAVCDEEFASIGTRALLANGLHATGAIITEPTRMAVCPAHKGFAWIEITFHGHAAHGSRYDVGVDAVRHAGLFLTALDRFERDTLTTRRHDLIGRPSVHASTIAGGTGWSTYAEQCVLRIERRTIPGETSASVVAEVTALCDALSSERHSFRADVTLVSAQPPSDLSVSAPLTRAVCDAITHMNAFDTAHTAHVLTSNAGRPARIEGLSCWTDAALFNAAGIPALCYGPGDIARAHSAEEWVSKQEIVEATHVLERVCLEWGR